MSLEALSFEVFRMLKRKAISIIRRKAPKTKKLFNPPFISAAYLLGIKKQEMVRRKNRFAKFNTYFFNNFFISLLLLYLSAQEIHCRNILQAFDIVL